MSKINDLDHVVHKMVYVYAQISVYLKKTHLYQWVFIVCFQAVRLTYKAPPFIFVMNFHPFDLPYV